MLNFRDKVVDFPTASPPNPPPPSVSGQGTTQAFAGSSALKMETKELAAPTKVCLDSDDIGAWKEVRREQPKSVLIWLTNPSENQWTPEPGKFTQCLEHICNKHSSYLCSEEFSGNQQPGWDLTHSSHSTTTCGKMRTVDVPVSGFCKPKASISWKFYLYGASLVLKSIVTFFFFVILEKL